jgi:hypothetical protein
MIRRTAAWLVSIALVVAACGGGGGDNRAGGPPSTKSLVAEVASFDLAVGPPARFIVGLLTQDQEFVSYGSVRLRFTYEGRGEKNAASSPGPTTTAAFISLPGSPPAGSRRGPVAVASSEGKGVYGAPVAFDRAGFWKVAVDARLVGETRTRTATAAFEVRDKHALPAVGDPALATENLTVHTPNAPPAAIDSRADRLDDVPDAELHQTTIARALALHRPAVVVFATPVYCVSQFCGPVTDMVNELAGHYADRASFIHVEIWQNYEQHELTKAAAEWLFRNNDVNEPWVFVIGADGRIAARFDNVVTREDVESLLRNLPVIGREPAP